MRSKVDRDPQLTAALEAALVRELRATWWQMNEAFFRSGLRPPTIELVPTRHTLGRWTPATRTIEMSRPLVLERPWAAVVEVLKHEMAHQYVHETLGETSQTPHGRAFQEACARLGVDGRASGMPDAVAGSDGDEKIVERIARLLALAESPNQHEAEAAMAAAQRLMLKHNLEVARSRVARDYRHVHLGKPTAWSTRSCRPPARSSTTPRRPSASAPGSGCSPRNTRWPRRWGRRGR